MLSCLIERTKTSTTCSSGDMISSNGSGGIVKDSIHHNTACTVSSDVSIDDTLGTSYLETPELRERDNSEGGELNSCSDKSSMNDIIEFMATSCSDDDDDDEEESDDDEPSEGNDDATKQINHIKEENDDEERRTPPSPSSTAASCFDTMKKKELVKTSPSKARTYGKDHDCTKKLGRSSFYADFSALATTKVLLSLEEYDRDLATITSSPPSQVVPVDRNELQRVSLLGKGHFSNVYLVTGSLPEAPSITTSTAISTEDHIQTRSRRRKMYAYKSIDTDRVTNADELIVAAKDLATEAFILSQLDHENIIKLRGLCSETFSKSFADDGIFDTIEDLSGSFKHPPPAVRSSTTTNITNKAGLKGYFLVLDVLTESLSERLYRWRKNQKMMLDQEKKTRRRKYKLRRSSINGCIAGGSAAAVDVIDATTSIVIDDEKRTRMYERVENVALGIAKGMEYLSSKNIVLRDLKPGNVGFDSEDSLDGVKLFDFGMARKVEDCDPNEVCGSPRYMAPESMSGKGYTLKVDVYSFGILLYELCSLNVPFAELHGQHNQNSNFNKKKNQSSSSRRRRPSLSKSSSLSTLHSSSSSLLSKIVRTCSSSRALSSRRKSINSSSSSSSFSNESNSENNKTGNENGTCNNSSSNSNNINHNATTKTLGCATLVDDQTKMTEAFYRKVVQDKIRPSDNIDFSSVVPCNKLRTLIEDCWESDPTKRPTFQQIVPRIQDMLLQNEQQQ